MLNLLDIDRISLGILKSSYISSRNATIVVDCLNWTLETVLGLV